MHDAIQWLHLLALGSLGLAGLSAAVISAHINGHLSAGTPEFWFAMQWAMIGGFITSYPVNAWLIRAGIKAAM